MSDEVRTPSIADLKDAPPATRPGRLKPLRTVEDINAVPYFDDEDREVATEMLLRSIRIYGNQATMTVATMIHNPKLARAKATYGEVMSQLVGNVGDTRHTTQGSLLHLLILSVLRFCKDEALVGALSAGNGRAVPTWKPHHLALMDYPESEVWSEEQRLMLYFARAVLYQDMTDEIWDKAVKAWGVKQVLRYIQYAGHFFTTGIRNNALKITHPLSRDERYTGKVA